MTKANWVLPILLWGAFGCSSNGAPPDASDDGPAGSLSVKLEAVDAQGELYRLRDAQFNIYGYAWEGWDYTDINVSSETDPSSPTINTRLLEGSYTVSFLESGWFIEHVTAAGTERVEKVAFLGPRALGAYVYRGTSTPVSFRFGVNGELIDFIGGDLEIGITVEQAPSSGGSTGSGGSSGGVEAGAGGAI